jgi:hypothetical protein
LKLVKNQGLLAFELKRVKASDEQLEGTIIEIRNGEVAFEEKVLNGVEGEGGIMLSSAEEEGFGGLCVDEEFLFFKFESELNAAGILEGVVSRGVGFSGGGLHVQVG